MFTGAPVVAGLPVAGLPVTKELPAAKELPAVRALPDPFTFLGGAKVQGVADWPARRRELAELIQHYAYGYLPAPPDAVRAELEAGRLTISVAAGGRRGAFDVQVTLPPGLGPFPAFIFAGAPGGRTAPPLETFIDRGYAVLRLDTNAIASDTHPSRGVFADLYPGADAGVLMAWAWALHRVVDAAAQVPGLEARRLAVSGFSRWGKAALLAGALDDRIALTVPSSSGLSGVGQYRYFYESPADASTRNEKIGNIIGYAPQWFTPRFAEFEHTPDRLPFDQHEVMAMVAPRALLMSTGKEDHWCNPRGSALSFRAAQKVFNFLGAPLALGCSWDAAGHELTAKHIGDMLDFANLHFAGTTLTRNFQELPDEFTDEPDAHPWQAP